MAWLLVSMAGLSALMAGLLRRYGMHPALDRRQDLRLLGLGAVGVAALTASPGQA